MSTDVGMGMELEDRIGEGTKIVEGVTGLGMNRKMTIDVKREC